MKLFRLVFLLSLLLQQGLGQGNGGNGGQGGGNGGQGGDGNGGQGGGNGGQGDTNCNKFSKDETECAGEGCFFCSEKKLCRSSADKCPLGGSGGGGGNVCNRQKDEAACSSAGCFYCSDKNLCRKTEKECPGKGSMNPCKNLTDTDCSENEACLWCADANRCTSSRGGQCGGGGNNGKAKQKCQDFAEESECTSTTTCRWCPTASKCLKVQASCGDGSAGVRGNPCKGLNSTEACTGVEGCLWCMDNNKCKKDTDECDGSSSDSGDSDESASGDASDGDTADDNEDCEDLFKAECDAESTCQWCAENENCRKADVLCESRGAEATLDLDYSTAGFNLQNDGLGKADPKKVSVAIKYLFEVAADGTQIGSSFVDIESQTFTASQVQGTFYGLQARKISFDASITNVGDIQMEVYHFLASGTVETPTGETYSINTGDVKFNVNIENWNFCDSTSCGSEGEAGEFIDFALEILGESDDPEQNENDASVFELGGGVPVRLSNQIQVDQGLDAMPEGYPHTESSAQGTVFVLRFPKFQESLSFDPIVEAEAIKAKPASDSSGQPGDSVPFCCTIMGVAITSMFVLMIGV